MKNNDQNSNGPDEDILGRVTLEIYPKQGGGFDYAFDNPTNFHYGDVMAALDHIRLDLYRQLLLASLDAQGKAMKEEDKGGAAPDNDNKLDLIL